MYLQNMRYDKVNAQHKLSASCRVHVAYTADLSHERHERHGEWAYAGIFAAGPPGVLIKLACFTRLGPKG